MRPFSQAETGLDRAHNSLGLGLPITRLAAEWHNGRLTIANVSKCGFVALIILPLSVRATDRRGTDDRRHAAALVTGDECAYWLEGVCGFGGIGHEALTKLGCVESRQVIGPYQALQRFDITVADSGVTQKLFC